jgi:hypothetical protein
MHVHKNTSSYVGCVAVPHHMFDDLRIIFRAKPNKSPFLAEKSGVNPLEKLSSEHFHISIMDTNLGESVQVSQAKNC